MQNFGIKVVIQYYCYIYIISEMNKVEKNIKWEKNHWWQTQGQNYTKLLQQRTEVWWQFYLWVYSKTNIRSSHRWTRDNSWNTCYVQPALTLRVFDNEALSSPLASHTNLKLPLCVGMRGTGRRGQHHVGLSPQETEVRIYIIFSLTLLLTFVCA